LSYANLHFQYIFGPVPSRRFGRSLGVDLIPHKTCSLNCIFCQLGRTTHQTVKRQEYVPITDATHELQRWLEQEGAADYIALSGSGEPTLHSHFARALNFVKEKTALPAVLLTNGSLMHVPAVRSAACKADIVKITLCAWDHASYQWINRPHSTLDFKKVIKGQKIFRDNFNGEIWLEIFLLNGINSFPENVEQIAHVAESIKPDRIQLNTVVRPPAENYAIPVPKSELKKLTTFFEPKAEVISDFDMVNQTTEIDADTILKLLRRRPCTGQDISNVFGLHPNETAKYLGLLLNQQKIIWQKKENKLYYIVKNNT